MKSLSQRDRLGNRSPVPTGIGHSESGAISAELHAANQRLLARQRERQPNKPSRVDRTGRTTMATVSSSSGGWLNVLHQIKPSSAPTQPAKVKATTVVVFPSLASTFLKEERAAEARLWLLCKAQDVKGQGWLHADSIKRAFAGKQAEQRLCGWRRLRQVLQQGNGTFWLRDDAGRVWLRSAEKVAAAFGLTRLTGRPVHVPVAGLASSLRSAKAHLYASFHSGRNQAPISRAALSAITGTAERTQRSYDHITRTVKRRNIAIGQVATPATHHKHFATRPGAFELTDKVGKQGPAGTRYHAWRLPNSYEAIHKQVDSNRLKRTNRKLRCCIDLANHRAQGNSTDQRNSRLFFDGAEHKLRVSNHEQYLFNQTLGVWHCINVR